MSSHNSPDVRQALLDAIPRLRALAIGLCGNGTQAEDLVQEALTRAWANLSSFQPGTNMEAWLYTILRNEFYTYLRKRRREVPDPDGVFAATLVSAPAQEGHLNFQDLRVGLAKLAPPLREAILLVGASGLSVRGRRGDVSLRCWYHEKSRSSRPPSSHADAQRDAVDRRGLTQRRASEGRKRRAGDGRPIAIGSDRKVPLRRCGRVPAAYPRHRC